MINKLSYFFVDKLISTGAIDKDDMDLYAYGLFMLINHILFFLVASVFGLVLHCLIESIILYISFLTIRRYAGGYHATTETSCMILSTLSILICIIIIRFFKEYGFQLPILFVSSISAIIIFFICPLDTPEKPLSNKEYKHFRRVSWIVLLAIGTTITISFLLNLQIVVVPCCLSLILESLLLIAGKVKKVN